jgi:hypothetical protein
VSADRITDRDDPVPDPARLHPHRQVQHRNSDISGSVRFAFPGQDHRQRREPVNLTTHVTFLRNGHRLLRVLTGCGQVTQATERLGMLYFHVTSLQRVIGLGHFFNFLEDELADTPAVVDMCAGGFEAVWQRAIPHAQYRPA